jgi:hypothetical protein
MHESPSRARLHARIAALLRRRVLVTGQVVVASYQELAEELGGDVSAREVRAAFVDLGQESYFHGRPHLSEGAFRVRLAW